MSEVVIITNGHEARDTANTYLEKFNEFLLTIEYMGRYIYIPTTNDSTQ